MIRLRTSTWLYLAAALLLAGASPARAECTGDLPAIVRADQPADAPRFEDYRVPVYTGKPAAPDVRSHPRSRQFRTELREAAAEGVNFAGHYRLVSWGCGCVCYQWAVVNVKTGKVIHPANLRSTDHANVAEDLFDDDGRAVGFRPGSRLLAVYGRINDDAKQHGISWFVWENERFRRIRFQPKAAPGNN